MKKITMKRTIAICGLDCSKCDAYIATKNNAQTRENLKICTPKTT